MHSYHNPSPTLGGCVLHHQHGKGTLLLLWSLKNISVEHSSLCWFFPLSLSTQSFFGIVALESHFNSIPRPLVSIYLICDGLFAQRHYLLFPTFKYLRKCAITFVCIVLKLFKSHIKDLALVDAKSFKWCCRQTIGSYTSRVYLITTL